MHMRPLVVRLGFTPEHRKEEGKRKTGKQENGKIEKENEKTGNRKNGDQGKPEKKLKTQIIGDFPKQNQK